MVGRPLTTEMHNSAVRTPTTPSERTDSLSVMTSRRLVGKENAIGNGLVEISVESPEVDEVICVDVLDDDDDVQKGAGYR